MRWPLHGATGAASVDLIVNCGCHKWFFIYCAGWVFSSS